MWTRTSDINRPVPVTCLWGSGPVLGTGSCWLLDSLVEDLLVLAILVEPSLLDWSGRERERDTAQLNRW